MEVVRTSTEKVHGNPAWEDREISIRIADALIIHCPELGPAIVLLFAPPYYPAVNSSDDLLVKQASDLMKQVVSESFNQSVSQIHYIKEIYDLRYVNCEWEPAEWQ